MADNLAEIRKLFADAGVILPQNDVWAVQGTPVVKHKALERLSAKLGIKWHEPKILRAERDEAVILVMGSLGEHMEWSVGEAMIVPAAGVGGNYKVSGKQASYVWAMAEKRGKDRVIIKLAGIDAYSEEESDDFKERQQASPDQSPTEFLKSAEKSLETAAMLGTVSLRLAWQNLPENTRELFGGKAPERLKTMAAEFDQREKKEAA